MSKRFAPMVFGATLLIIIAGCSDFRRAIGDEKSTPMNSRLWSGRHCRCRRGLLKSLTIFWRPLRR